MNHPLPLDYRITREISLEYRNEEPEAVSMKEVPVNWLLELLLGDSRALTAAGFTLLLAVTYQDKRNTKKRIRAPETRSTDSSLRLQIPLEKRLT